MFIKMNPLPLREVATLFDTYSVPPWHIPPIINSGNGPLVLRDMYVVTQSNVLYKLKYTDFFRVVWEKGSLMLTHLNGATELILEAHAGEESTFLTAPITLPTNVIKFPGVAKKVL